MSHLANYISKILNRAFIVPDNKRAYRVIKSSLGGTDENAILVKFIEYLSTLSPKADDEDQGNYKVDYIVTSVDIKPSKILDIGAGKATVLAALSEKYNIPKEHLYALDLQPIIQDEVTVITYTDDMKIPLKDGSIDLIIMLSLLHHIDPVGRDELLNEVFRVLSPNGRIMIREHDDNKNLQFRIFLQLIHYIWYVKNNEPHDPLFLMSRANTNALFTEHGFTSVKYVNPGFNVQRIYGEVYKKQVHSQQ